MSGRRKRERFTTAVPPAAAPTDAPTVAAELELLDDEPEAEEPAPEPTPIPTPTPTVLAHEPSGERCGAYHDDGRGPCERCKHCRVKVRPQHMGRPCPART